MRWEVLIPGFPGRTSRGFLGWSTTVLLEVAGDYALFDTGGAGDRPSLLSGLAARGIRREGIRTVILSHFHFDHIANVECFPEAEIIVHQEELAYFDDQRGRDDALPVFQIEGLMQRGRLSLVADELDVLEGVRMIRTPGHTSGHCSLVLNVAGQRVVLAQDAVKHRGEARSGQASGAFDPDLAAASIRRILNMADVIVPGHDAPLTITDGKVASAGPVREDITVTIDGRTVSLEVAG